MFGATMEPFPYRLIQPLPPGGMCDLYLALRERDQRPVVIKQLNAAHRERERSVRRFIAEAALLSRLDHPNIVRRLDFGSAAQRGSGEESALRLRGPPRRALAHARPLIVAFRVHSSL